MWPTAGALLLILALLGTSDCTVASEDCTVAFEDCTVASEDCTAVSEHSPADTVSQFRAAVFEHFPHMKTMKTLSRAEALMVMQKNLNVYTEQAEKAKQQEAQIIVFPESGLYGAPFNRKTIFPFLEKIPDPEMEEWSPCSDPLRFPETQVLHAFSCMAKDHGLYVVANMGDCVPCDVTADPSCPSDGRFQYNTDVAFGPDGKLLVKYHKTHLFFEPQFDTPQPKVVYFDTPFGRIGMTVCFDLLFKEPAVTSVTDFNITTMAYPTAWSDALPLLSALGYHSSFARGLGVNLLTANTHFPLLAFQGSGIYTPRGAASYYYNNKPMSAGKLLVSTLDTVPTKPKKYEIKPDITGSINYDRASEFQSKLFHDTYTFKLLKESSGELDVCQNNLCCSLSYNISNDNSAERGVFAFGAFDGLHTFQGQYYVQVCTLIKCTSDCDKSTCGSPTTTSNTRFQHISISGNFQTSFIFPQVVLSESSQLILAEQDSWNFEENKLNASDAALKSSLLSATLLGRVYSRDNNAN